MIETLGLSDFERRAFNLAGHAVIGVYLDIDIRHFAISEDDGEVTFAPLREICDLRHSPPKRIKECAQKYVTFALSGIASELVRIEKHHRIAARSKGRKSFLRRWQSILFEENAFDLDFAYFTTATWLKADQTCDVEVQLNRLWAGTYNLVISSRIWREIELVAGQLLTKGPMTGDEVRALLGESAASEWDHELTAPPSLFSSAVVYFGRLD